MNGRATIGRPAGTVAENLFLENYISSGFYGDVI
jgi:hypothetical protein